MLCSHYCCKNNCLIVCFHFSDLLVYLGLVVSKRLYSLFTVHHLDYPVSPNQTGVWCWSRWVPAGYIELYPSLSFNLLVSQYDYSPVFVSQIISKSCVFWSPDSFRWKLLIRMARDVWHFGLVIWIPPYMTLGVPPYCSPVSLFRHNNASDNNAYWITLLLTLFGPLWKGYLFLLLHCSFGPIICSCYAIAQKSRDVCPNVHRDSCSVIHCHSFPGWLQRSRRLIAFIHHCDRWTGEQVYRASYRNFWSRL